MESVAGMISRSAASVFFPSLDEVNVSVVTRLPLSFMLTLTAAACSSPPDKVSIYPGFTLEQMSRLEPGTGEYLKEHRPIYLDPVTVDVIDPTTSRPFLSLEGTFTILSSALGEVLNVATIHAPDDRGPIATRDSLVGAVRAFIDRGWKCRDRDNLEGPVLDGSTIALPDEPCVARLDYGRGWTCESPPRWPSASTFFRWGCGDASNNFSLSWTLEMVAFPE